jgi:2-oxoglutarate ferredoxin oxidoreductase subunit alpha
MQARWGSHGDYQIIVLAASSPQEAFDLTIRSFNLAEEYRTPVILLLDEAVGHMLERVVIPPLAEIKSRERRYTHAQPGAYRPFEITEDGVPPMAPIGHGFKFHVTGLTHDEQGYPVMNAETQDVLLRRLRRKILDREEQLTDVSLDEGDFSVLVFAYGITARIARRAVDDARRAGLNVGLVQVRTLWPFPEKALRRIVEERGVKAVVVPELNLGQMVYEVERIIGCRARVYGSPHAGGAVHDPEVILAVIEQAQKEIGK